MEQAGDSTISPFVTTVSSARGNEASFDEFLECAGGVGGRSMEPSILLDVCFSVRGEAFMDDGEVISVSRLRPRDALVEVGCVEGVDVKFV